MSSSRYTCTCDYTDKIRGLGLGADDYISKPFYPPELVARVKSNLAQYDRLKARSTSFQYSEKILESGAIRINMLTHCVCVDGMEMDLKNKEYEMLVFMMQNSDIVFSKERLYERIWGMDALGDLKTVAVHINRLREKSRRIHSIRYTYKPYGELATVSNLKNTVDKIIKGVFIV